MFDWDSGAQPQSYFTSPMQSNFGSASDMNPYAQTGADLLKYGLSRLIDVQTVRALEGTNTHAVLQSSGATISTYGGVPSGGYLVGGALLPLLLAGAVIYMLAD